MSEPNQNPNRFNKIHPKSDTCIAYYKNVALVHKEVFNKPRACSEPNLNKSVRHIDECTICNDDYCNNNIDVARTSGINRNEIEFGSSGAEKSNESIETTKVEAIIDLNFVDNAKSFVTIETTLSESKVMEYNKDNVINYDSTKKKDIGSDNSEKITEKNCPEVKAVKKVINDVAASVRKNMDKVESNSYETVKNNDFISEGSTVNYDATIIDNICDINDKMNESIVTDTFDYPKSSAIVGNQMANECHSNKDMFDVACSSITVEDITDAPKHAISLFNSSLNNLLRSSDDLEHAEIQECHLLSEEQNLRSSLRQESVKGSDERISMISGTRLNCLLPEVSSSLTIDGRRCRICMSCSFERLITPCHCKGTLGTVHVTCLERWLSSSGRASCEVCGYSFPVVTTQRYSLYRALVIWFSFSRSRTTFRTDCLFFWTLTLLTASLVSCCLIGSKYFVEQSFAIGLPRALAEGLLHVLVVFVVCGFVITTYVLWRDHIAFWKRWRMATIDVRLVIEDFHHDDEQEI